MTARSDRSEVMIRQASLGISQIRFQVTAQQTIERNGEDDWLAQSRRRLAGEEPQNSRARSCPLRRCCATSGVRSCLMRVRCAASGVRSCLMRWCCATSGVRPAIFPLKPSQEWASPPNVAGCSQRSRTSASMCQSPLWTTCLRYESPALPLSTACH